MYNKRQIMSASLILIITTSSITTINIGDIISDAKGYFIIRNNPLSLLPYFKIQGSLLISPHETIMLRIPVNEDLIWLSRNNIFNSYILEGLIKQIWVLYSDFIWNDIMQPNLLIFIPSLLMLSQLKMLFVKIIILSICEYLFTAKYQIGVNKKQKFANIIVYQSLVNMAPIKIINFIFLLCALFVMLDEQNNKTKQGQILRLGVSILYYIALPIIFKFIFFADILFKDLLMNTLNIYIIFAFMYYVSIKLVIASIEKVEKEALSGTIINEESKRKIENFTKEILEKMKKSRAAQVHAGLIFESHERKTGKTETFKNIMQDLLRLSEENEFLFYKIDLRKINDIIKNNDPQSVSKIEDDIITQCELKQKEVKKPLLVVLNADEVEKFPDLLLFIAKIFHDMGPKLNKMCSDMPFLDNKRSIMTIICTTNDLQYIVNFMGADTFAARRISNVVYSDEHKSMYKKYLDEVMKDGVCHFGEVDQGMIEQRIKQIYSFEKEGKAFTPSEDIIKSSGLNFSVQGIIGAIVGKFTFQVMAEIEDAALSDEEKEKINSQEDYNKAVDMKLDHLFKRLQEKMHIFHPQWTVSQKSILGVTKDIRRAQEAIDAQSYALTLAQSTIATMLSTITDQTNKEAFNRILNQIKSTSKPELLKLHTQSIRYLAETVPVNPSRMCAQTEVLNLAWIMSILHNKSFISLPLKQCSLAAALVSPITDFGQFTNKSEEKLYMKHETYFAFICALYDSIYPTFPPSLLCWNNPSLSSLLDDDDCYTTSLLDDCYATNCFAEFIDDQLEKHIFRNIMRNRSSKIAIAGEFLHRLNQAKGYQEQKKRHDLERKIYVEIKNENSAYDKSYLDGLFMKFFRKQQKPPLKDSNIDEAKVMKGIFDAKRITLKCQNIFDNHESIAQILYEIVNKYFEEKKYDWQNIIDCINKLKNKSYYSTYEQSINQALEVNSIEEINNLLDSIKVQKEKELNNSLVLETKAELAELEKTCASLIRANEQQKHDNAARIASARQELDELKTEIKNAEAKSQENKNLKELGKNINAVCKGVQDLYSKS